VNSPVDLEDLRKHTHYGGLYGDKQETITTFWNVRSCTSDYLSPELTSTFNSGRRLLRSRAASGTTEIRHILQLATTSVSHFICFPNTVANVGMRLPVGSRSSCLTSRFAMLAKTSNVYQPPVRVLIFSRYDSFHSRIVKYSH